MRRKSMIGLLGPRPRARTYGYQVVLLGVLRNLGYDRHRAEHAGLLRGTPVGDDDVMRWRRWDIFAVPRP